MNFRARSTGGPAATLPPRKTATASPAPARQRPGWQRAASAAARPLRAHWLLGLLLLAGTLLRLCAGLGFPPVIWFNDGLEYLGVALRWQAYPVRPDGYSLFLRLLLPFHSFSLVAALQHLMGLAVAVLLYALLRRWRVPAWLAALGVAPQLLDVQQIELEHMVLSDTLFTLLLTAGIVLLAWRRRVTPLLAGAGGLLLALAALTRTVGLPFVLLGGVYLLARWQGWRPLAAYAVLAAAPLGLYAGWYHHEHGSYGLDTADGVFLYSRVMVFADCGVIRPPADLTVLCPPADQARMSLSSDYIWQPESPLDRLPGTVSSPVIPEQMFNSQHNGPARRFAIDAITAQPLAYLRDGLQDFARSFTWTREPYPSAADVSDYSFSLHPLQVQSSQVYVPGGSAGNDMRQYEHGDARTTVVQPWAGLIIGAQRYLFLPGTLLAVLLAAGLAGLVRRRSERRVPVLILWVSALALLAVPPFTAEFGYRYVLPAVPLAGAVAALTVAGLTGRHGRHAVPRPQRRQLLSVSVPAPRPADLSENARPVSRE